MGNEATILTLNFTTIALIMSNVSAFIGVCMIFGAIFQFKKHGESRTAMSQNTSLVAPMMLIVAGAMLLILPKFIGAVMIAFWGSNSLMSYSGGPTGSSSLIDAVIVMIRLVGIGSFIRGIVLLARSGGQQHQPGTLGKAVIHMIAGVLCINIVATVTLLQNIMGLN